MIKSILTYMILLALINGCSTQEKRRQENEKDKKKSPFLLTQSIDSFSKLLDTNKCSQEYEKTPYEIFSLNNNNFPAKKVQVSEINDLIKKTHHISKSIDENIAQLNPRNTIEKSCIKNLMMTKTAFDILRNYLIDLHYWRTKDSKKYKGHVYNNFRMNKVIKRSSYKRKPASSRSFKRKVKKRQRKIGLPLTPVEMQSLY